MPDLRTCHFFTKFGCVCAPERLTLVHYDNGCWCFPDDNDQWLCPQHVIKGLQNNGGLMISGYMKDQCSL